MNILPILSTLRRHKITATLVILEIALSCAIICNAVFLISQRLERTKMISGVAEHELVQIQIGSIRNRPDEIAQTQADLAALGQIPGVKQVTVTNEMPFDLAGSWNNSIMLNPQQQSPTLNATTYFGKDLVSTFGLRLVAGRNFRPEEYIYMNRAMEALQKGQTQHLPHVVIVSRELAQRLWPGKPALGKMIYIEPHIGLQVVGVVQRLVRPNNLQQGTPYSMLWPIRLTPKDGGMFVIRCAPQDRQRVIRAALTKLKTIDPNTVILKKQTYDEIRANFFENDRAMAGTLIGVIVALLLVTALGIVGLASFWVAQRRRTIGVRRALGATRMNILNYFQTENFLLATIGIVVGMVLAYGINLFLMTHYELPRLPWTYMPVGAVALWLVGQLAVLGPALRAAQVPPVVATRPV